ncbi:MULTISPECIES: hypothetical protein [unclassified Streptomyces]|uniref:hypothetical protein n=1 Tax=unclassified Streptomyces TaxID=2593676 RepID=UPI0037FDDC86
MTMTRAITCNTTGCVALYLGDPLLTLTAVRLSAQRAGWDAKDAGTSDRCPSCRSGGLPVLERGECPVCCGSTFATGEGDRCHHCGHVIPAPPDELADEDEDQEHGEQLHAAEDDR